MEIKYKVLIGLMISIMLMLPICGACSAVLDLKNSKYMAQETLGMFRLSDMPIETANILLKHDEGLKDEPFGLNLDISNFKASKITMFDKTRLISMTVNGYYKTLKNGKIDIAKLDEPINISYTEEVE